MFSRFFYAPATRRFTPGFHIAGNNTPAGKEPEMIEGNQRPVMAMLFAAILTVATLGGTLALFQVEPATKQVATVTFTPLV
jgi:hypothetical protein